MSRLGVFAGRFACTASRRRVRTIQQLRSISAFPDLDVFEPRHIGITPRDQQVMLGIVGEESMDSFVRKVVPASIRKRGELPEEEPMGEAEWLKYLKNVMSKNKIMKQCIGMGYYETKLPNVILRNVLENPSWYTPYTPYQAEISQGRLESLLNFQQMVTDLTGFSLANASLLDEATACGEAVAMAVAQHRNKRKTVLVDQNLHPSNIAVTKTRCEGFGFKFEVGDVRKADLTNPDLAVVVVQYPNTFGALDNPSTLFSEARKNKVFTCCVCDLLSLTVLTPPGELGADIACGSAQRFGVPLGYGGPHAAFFAASPSFARLMPGRIIGVSRDVRGKTAFRMALQTREQHIKRERATSNICTAQALLANISAFYAVWHGPKGLRQIAEDIHLKTRTLAEGLEEAGFTVVNKSYFDTLHVRVAGMTAQEYITACEEQGVNIRYHDQEHVGISVDECTNGTHIAALLRATGKPFPESGEELQEALTKLRDRASEKQAIPDELSRVTEYLQHPTFNRYHSEMELQRYIHRLVKKDMGLDTAMIPLGSCTMKLNAAVEMLPITWESINSIHPFAPEHQVQGYNEMLKDMSERLCQLTGMDACSLQPNSGSQGEYAGLRCIRSYHEAQGNTDKDICVIPASAHGTNPASAVMAGFKVAVVRCTSDGSIDMEDLRSTLFDKHKDRVGAFMITYPSTFGVFDENIKQITSMVHEAGGQVYVDGANFNAQMGVAFPGDYGGDVLHLNLHKTFSIPHGGGGPGMGPICMKAHLAPYMPHCASPGLSFSGENSFGQVCQAAFSSASILPISWTFMRLMTFQGLQRASEAALLNANYLMARLSISYPVLFTNERGRCAHEFILDVRPMKKFGVEVEDIAKRLMDYNFHAPTMSFPVAGTLMIEPTESESRAELDRLVEALLLIREEIREIEEGKMDPQNNPLKNAPHTAEMIAGDWPYPYSRERAVYPAPFVRDNKMWPSVGRIDSAFGDRNFICSCPPIESYTSA